MTHDGEELGFRAVRRLGLLSRVTNILVRDPPFGDRRTEQQAGRRDDRHERLQEHEPLAQIRHGERTVAERRRKDRRHGDAQHSGRGAALPKAERRPEEDGDEDVDLMERRRECRHVWQTAEEGQRADDGQRSDERDFLQPVDLVLRTRR